MKIPSHSTVVAYLALFVAVGGSAYAVTQVDSGDIRNRSIQGKDVASDALGGKQINEAKLVWRARRRCRVGGRLATPHLPTRLTVSAARSGFSVESGLLDRDRRK